jgi:hypothetical protein
MSASACASSDPLHGREAHNVLHNVNASFARRAKPSPEKSIFPKVKKGSVRFIVVVVVGCYTFSALPVNPKTDDKTHNHSNDSHKKHDYTHRNPIQPFGRRRNPFKHFNVLNCDLFDSGTMHDKKLIGY